jgi:hypothetical protein
MVKASTALLSLFSKFEISIQYFMMKKLFYYITSSFRFQSSATLFILLLIISGQGWGQTYGFENSLLTKAKISTFPYLSANTLDNQIMLSVVSPNNTSDITIIYFKDGNSNGVDLNDGVYLLGGNPLNTLIYSYINSEKYCINALATYTAPITVNLGFEPKVNGNFSMTAGEILSFNPSSSVILEDLKTNTKQDLRLHPIYNFTATTSDAINRFKLHFNLAYTWNSASGNWNSAASWKPLRTFPSNSDILVFDGSLQPSPSVVLDFTNPQSIGRLSIINNANVTFATSDVPRILNIGVLNLDPPHLRLNAASSLTVNAANPIEMNLSTGIKANISGSLTMQNAAHRLIASDTNGIIFKNTAVFTAGTGFSGDAFGTTNLKNIIFESGSKYIYKSIEAPSLNGRTFANFELNAPGFNNNLTGSNGLTVDDLTITNCTSIGMNLTGTINIKGNLNINNGALNITPATTATVVFNGVFPQTISAGPGLLSVGANANFVVDNSVVFERDITFGGSLIINAAKTLTVTPGKQLSVNTGLQIKSDTNGTGSLIHSNAVNGSMERYISVLSWTDFHILGSPVTAQSIAAGFSPENQSFFAWNESNGSWIPYENAGFTAVNGNNLINPGKGYSVSYSTTSTKTFSGTFNQGTINTNLSYTPGGYTGWNLVANPYPSAINWNKASGFTRNMLEDAGFGDYAYWVWNPVSGNYGCFISNGSFGTNGVTNYIAPTQGFWVKAASAGSFSMNNNAREHCISQPWLKSVASSYKTLRLKVSAAENNYSDEMIVSLGYPHDSCGAEKLYSPYQTVPGLFSTKRNKNWSINLLSSNNTTTIIPVGFKPGKNGNFTISSFDINNIYSTTYIYLKDLLTNTITDLNQHTDYSFAATTQDNVMRFQLIFALSPLSVNDNEFQHTSIYSFDRTIYVNSNESVRQLSVFNVMGQLVKKLENTSGNLSFAMEGNASAYYIVRLVTNNNVYSEKVLIK